jgi:hypothetical protein
MINPQLKQIGRECAAALYARRAEFTDHNPFELAQVVSDAMEAMRVAYVADGVSDSDSWTLIAAISAVTFAEFDRMMAADEGGTATLQ